MDTEGIAQPPSSARSAIDADEQSSLPELGPVPGLSHWHGAYVVRVCDDVLEPFDTTDDPLGIHSHGDGLIHIHPFVEESGYEAARLGLFADAMGFDLADGALTLPGGGTWRDGDLCNGVPGRVFVDRWRDPEPESAVERIFEGVRDLRFRADGELYQIAFAPPDSLPVVPPATASLAEVSPVGRVIPEPWVDIDPKTTIADVSIWQVVDATASPCSEGQVPERVLAGEPLCFEQGAASGVPGVDAITSARAVLLNREPAVELRITTRLGALIGNHFRSSADPLALAIEVDGFVVSAPQVLRPSSSADRLVLTGGFSNETARQLAAVLGG